MKFLLTLFLFLITLSFSATPAQAIVNPLSTPNNRFGIHIIGATRDEASAAAELVNSNGDWGYITVLAESGDRNTGKWQEFFNYLREKHLIPIVRLATKPNGGFWERPYDGEEAAWAGFLDSLIWPTKNRYVIVYNEPNHATEWGNAVDPEGYAKVLDKTIDALKKKNPDFFVLNAGLDASAPQKAPAYLEESEYLRRMNEAVPGIFNKLDGWNSHSYPNPGFISSPDLSGKGTVRTYAWEQDVLSSFGANKSLPIFITETGWKHSEGIDYIPSLPSPETVASYYKQAFDEAWNNSKIVAVTPFLLNYQEAPFDHFSFKKASKATNTDSKDAALKDFHLPFYTLKDMPKVTGAPLQENKAKFIKGGIKKDNFTTTFEATSSSYHATLVSEQTYDFSVTLKNIGQSIWGDQTKVKLAVIDGANLVDQKTVALPDGVKVEPTSDYTFNFKLNSPSSGDYRLVLNLITQNGVFESDPFEFDFDVKSPVTLNVNASLKWKKSAAGQYILSIFGTLKNALAGTTKTVELNVNGKSQVVETKYLIPDTQYSFVLEKPFYKPKTLIKTVSSGENTLDFGELQPDLPSAIFHPTQLWNLFPWSE